jgi:hypothetical protein
LSTGIGIGGSPNGALIVRGVPVGIREPLSFVCRAAHRVYRAIKDGEDNEADKENRKHEQANLLRGFHGGSLQGSTKILGSSNLADSESNHRPECAPRSVVDRARWRKHGICPLVVKCCEVKL